MDSSPMKLKNIHGNVMAKVKLSEEQLKFYWDNGYLVLKELIDFNTLYACKQKFLRICNGVEDKGNIRVVKEISLIGKEKGERLINKVQDILYDDIFSLYTEHPVLLDVVGQILQSEDIVAIHSMFINKPPSTTRHPTHQDLYYFPYRPADKMVAAWTAIDDATTENGCLYVIPGSHKCGVIYDHGYPQKPDDKVNSMYHGILNEASLLTSQSAVELAMTPGDTVMFHPLLWHGSGANTSQNYRKSISVHYASDEHCRPVDLSGTNQQFLVSEIEGVTKRMGLDISFLDVWRGKSKGVRGVRSHL